MHTVNLKQAAGLALHARTTRFFFVGEPGIGKTSMVSALQDATGMDAAIMSCPDMDLGDVSMPVIDHDTRTTRYYPNARFKLQDGEPVIVVLDEYTKAPQPVQNMLHPMLESFRPRLGDIPIPEGSIILMTGNLESDGVGDSMAAHTRQRVCTVAVRKPTIDEWLEWASNNAIHPIVMAWADRNPHALASYLEGDQNENPYIFNPRHTHNGCVSPRTLELASRIMHTRDKYDYETLCAALSGVVGVPAAESMAQFVRHQDNLPAWKDIISDPTTTRIPTDTGAVAVLVFGMLEKVEKDTLAPIMEYLKRVDEEWQCLFSISLARNKTKQAIAFTNKAFSDWVVANEDLL